MQNFAFLVIIKFEPQIPLKSWLWDAVAPMNNVICIDYLYIVHGKIPLIMGRPTLNVRSQNFKNLHQKLKCSL